MANKMYWASGLTGGGDALDGIDGADLTVGDGAIVLYNDGSKNITFTYRLVSSSATEVSPGVVAPDSNPGTKRWFLTSIPPGEIAYPEWWGADPSGSVDSTTAIQAAIDCGGVGVYFTGDVYKHSAINITDKNGFRFYGNGKTELRWAGANDVPMLLIKNCEKAIVEKLWFNNTTANIPSACIESNITPATIPAVVNGVTGNIFRDLVLGGVTADNIKRGIHYTRTGVDQNNDQGSFINIEARNYSVAAVAIDHTQSYSHHFFNCRFVGGGPIGIDMTGGGIGGFSWYGGTMLGHTTADFVLGTVQVPVLISGLTSEGSKRLLTGAVSIGCSITVQGIRWGNNAIHADLNMITLQGGGPLNLIGNDFGSYSAGIPAITITNASDHKIAVVASGNTWKVTPQGTDPPPSPFILGTNATLISSGNMMSLTDTTSRQLLGTFHISGGNSMVGGSAVRSVTEGTKILNIFDGTAPSGTLANGVSIYSTAGEGYMMDAAGNATLQTPHDEKGKWIFYSKNTVTGKVLQVDMERMMKALNKKFGWDFIKEYIK